MDSTDFFSAVGLAEKLIENSHDGIIGFDKNCVYTIFNEAMEDISGIKRENVLGRLAFEVFPFLLEVGEDKYFKAALQGHEILSSDGKFRVPETGKTGTYEAFYSPLYNDKHNIVGGIAVVRETSEQNKTYRALKESELKLRHLNNVTTDAIITTNSHGKILSWNKSAESIFGYTESEVVFVNLQAILPDFKLESKMISLKPTDLPERSSRTNGFRKNGSTVPVRMSSSRWSLGEDVFLTLSICDLSDLTHLENQAEEQREISQTILQIHNELQQGLLSTELETNRPLFVNQAYADMLGYTVDEIMAMPNLINLVKPELIPMMKKRAENRIKFEKSSDFYETILIHKKGFFIHAEVALKVLDTSFGRTTYNIVRDITHKKLAEETLRKSERQFRFIFEKAKNVIVTLDAEGLITSLNPSFESTLGYPRLDWIGKSFAILVYPEDVTKLLECYKEASNPLNLDQWKIRLVNSKNQVFPSEISAASTVEDGYLRASVLMIRVSRIPDEQ